MSIRIYVLLLAILLANCSKPDDVQPVITEQEAPSIDAWGPHTAGSEITWSGRKLKLPDDVYVEAIVATITCLIKPGEHCPNAPYLVLRSGEYLLRIEADGEMYVPEIEDDKIAKAKEKFKFMTDTTGQPIKDDKNSD